MKSGTKVLGAAASIVMATALAPATAQAAAGFDRCPANRFCIFDGSNGTGTYAYFATADGNLGDSNGPQGMNNITSSVWNRTGYYWFLAPDAGYGGTGRIYSPGFKGAVASDINNRASSLCRTASGGSTTCT